MYGTEPRDHPGRGIAHSNKAETQVMTMYSAILHYLVCWSNSYPVFTTMHVP
jgi:hypothetical protein